jgi:hypothetical protein
MNRLPYDDSMEVIMNQLHRAGWTIGYVGHGTRLLVTGDNGENKIHAAGDTLAEAWRVALEQAKAVGMARHD